MPKVSISKEEKSKRVIRSIIAKNMELCAID